MDWQSVLKYNPNHDPKTGRFTFAGQGGAALDSSFERTFRPPPSEVAYAKAVDSYDDEQAQRGLVSDKYAGKSSFAVVKALKEAHPHLKFPHMEEMHPLFLREVATQIDRMAALHPEAFQALDTVGMETTTGGTFDANAHAGAWAVMAHGHMRFNPRYFDLGGNLVTDARNEREANATPTMRAGSLINEMREAEAVGYHPAGCNTVGSIFVHEFGHHVQAFEQGDLDYLGHTAKRNGRLLVQSLRHDVDNDEAISTYSAVSNNEWFAEAFAAAYTHDKPREIRFTGRTNIKSIRDIFDHYFNDYASFVRGERTSLWAKARKEDLAQTDLDQAGRLPPTQGPKRRRHGFKRMFQYGEGLVATVTKANPYHDPKNGRFTTKAMGFMQEWQEGTQPHPFDDRTRLRRYVGVEMSPWPGMDQVHMSTIISFASKGKGEASEVLREITQMADERGITLDLTAKPIPGAGAEGKNLTKAQLIKWYKRHGFEQQPYGLQPDKLSDQMVRKPRPVTTQKYNKNHDPKTGRFTTANGGLPNVDDFIQLDQYSRERALAKLSLKDVDRLLSRVSIEEEAFADKLRAANPGIGLLEGDDLARTREYYQARIAIVDHYNKREVQAEVEEAINTVPHFFHGTFTEALTSIAENGISNTPQIRQHDISYYSGDRGKSVYMVTDVQSAIRWGQVASSRSTQGAVVLKVRIPKEERAKIVQDESFPYSAKTFRIPRHIPPEWIESYTTVPKEVMFDAAGNPKASLHWEPLHPRKVASDTDGVFYVVMAVSERPLQTSARPSDQKLSKQDQFSQILKFNPFHDTRGRFTTAQNARQQEGHDELPTVEAMNRAMQLVGMEEFERQVVAHLDTLGRPVFGTEQAYEIERVARRIVAANRGTVTKCDFTMPISYFYEIGDAYRAFKYSESQPRDDRGRWTLAGSGFASPDTPEFKAWFGRSAVVNKDGTPMRVFHGTNREDITEFKAFSHFGTAQAANDRVKTLYDFSVDTVGRDPGNFQVMPLYLSMQNPLRLPDLASLEGSVEDDDGKPLMRAWEHENDLMEVLHEQDVVTTDEFWEHQYDNNEEIIKLLEEKGYDGIVYNNAVEHKGRDSYIIFHPWQVKSASGNSGRYDPNDPHVAKFDESKHPREPAGTPKGGQFAPWRQGTGMYFDDKVWRYGGDHSEVPRAVADRLKAMAIPPASINVHLNPNADEPLQATWTAKNGKLQYRYSAEATGNNAAEKFSRLKDFNAAMPKLRRQSREDMLQGRTQAERDTAAVVNLMAKTGFRVGGENEFETRKGKAYGASTLLDRHVVVNGNKLTFDFPGKHAVMQSHELDDMLLAQYIRNRKRHTTKDERLFATNEGRINKYLKDVTGQPFSAKDFRTWHGTHTALTVLKRIGEITTESEYRKARIHVGDVVAKKLGNTRNVALGSYIDPTVWGRWLGKEKKKVKA